MHSKKQHRSSATRTSWNNVASWYTEHLSIQGTYLQTIVFPGALRLLEPKKHGSYVDIACGEGSFLRLLASHVQDVNLLGIDAAPDLIAQATRLAQDDTRFRYVRADAQSFASKQSEDRFDGATCLMAIQNIENIEAVFQNSARFLSAHAPFVIVMNHPCFRAPQQSGWGFDNARKLQYRRMDRYLSPYAQPILAHPGSLPSLKTISYHRPLSLYVAALRKTGFTIDALEEWISEKTSDSGPRAKAENIARKEFPLFLAIRARRIETSIYPSTH